MDFFCSNPWIDSPHVYSPEYQFCFKGTSTIWWPMNDWYKSVQFHFLQGDPKTMQFRCNNRIDVSRVKTRVKLDQILGLNRSARLKGDIELWTFWYFDIWDEERRGMRRKIFREKKAGKEIFCIFTIFCIFEIFCKFPIFCLYSLGTHKAFVTILIGVYTLL